VAGEQLPRAAGVLGRERIAPAQDVERAERHVLHVPDRGGDHVQHAPLEIAGVRHGGEVSPASARRESLLLLGRRFDHLPLLPGRLLAEDMPQV
jgi:hypothetical protein